MQPPVFPQRRLLSDLTEQNAYPSNKTNESNFICVIDEPKNLCVRLDTCAYMEMQQMRD